MIEASSSISLIPQTVNKLDLQFKRIIRKGVSWVGCVCEKNQSSTMMFSQNILIRTERLKEDGKIYNCQVQLQRIQGQPDYYKTKVHSKTKSIIRE